MRILKPLLFSLLAIHTLALANDAFTLTVGGKARSVLVHAPAGIAAGKPLVISLHGMNLSAAHQQSTTNWDGVADTAKFVVAYPQSDGTTWDIGGNTDLNFIKAIIADMGSRYSIDLNRVYLSGFSMGGMLTYHAMNNMDGVFAAFGPVSGYMSTATTSSRPVPLLHIHGTSDGVVPYLAGNSGATGGYFPGIASIIAGWVTKNKCATTPATTTPYPAGKTNNNSKKLYSGCDNGVEVGLISLDGKDHYHSNDPAGVYSTLELWNFFKKYSLKGSAPSITSAANIELAEGSTEVIALVSDMSGATFTISGGADAARFSIKGSTLSFTQAPAYSSAADANKNNVYEVTIQVLANGQTGTKEMTVAILPPQGPYGGTVAAIPGTIELENYDAGGNGFAYFDKDEGSETGVSYRTDEDVDIEVCTDVGGGYNVGWAKTGEWLEYTVNVATAGTYALDIRVACNGDDRSIALDIDSKPIAANIAIPNTGGWQEWQTVTLPAIKLAAGPQIIRLTIGSIDYVNLNNMTFRLVSADSETPPVALASPESIQARGNQSFQYQVYNMNGVLVDFGVSATGNEFGNHLNAGTYLVHIKNSNHTTSVGRYEKR